MTEIESLTKEELQEASTVLRRHFSIELCHGMEGSSPFWELCKSALTGKLETHLRGSLSELLRVLYALDVEEEKVNRVFQGPHTAEIASSLAELILQRIRERVRKRTEYDFPPE